MRKELNMKKLGMLIVILLIANSCAGFVENSNNYMAWKEKRNCRNIQTTVTRWDSDTRTNRVVGRNYTRVCD